MGSQSWFLARANVAQQLFSSGLYREATQVSEEILTGLGEEPSYNRFAILAHLVRCLGAQGQVEEAKTRYLQGLAVAEQLEASKYVKLMLGALQTEWGKVLMSAGDYDGARTAFTQSLEIKREIGGDARGEAAVTHLLGTLELQQNHLQEAREYYREALRMFEEINEPESQGIILHQLGRVYLVAQRWDEAERAYRQACNIAESHGNMAGAARGWYQLAVVNQEKEPPNLRAAEDWCLKALNQFRELGDQFAESHVLEGLAIVLKEQLNRLPEARQLLEKALAIKQTLDPSVAGIGKTYHLLADIADRQGDTTQAKEYRRLSRQELAQFAGMQFQLQENAQLIAMVVAAVDNEQVRQQLEAYMEQLPEGWANLVAAIRAILEGERDEELLCEPLNFRDAAIVSAILRGIEERG